MPKFEGYNKLHAGYLRNITQSEMKRGYLFVSKDSAVREIVRNNSLELFIDGESYGMKCIDKHGRVLPGKNFSKYIKNKKTIYIRFYDEPLVINVITE